jgi:hypothetical protein
MDSSDILSNLTEQFNQLVDDTHTPSKLAFIPVSPHYWLINRSGSMYHVPFINCKMPFEFQKQGTAITTALRLTKRDNHKTINLIESLENFFESLVMLKGKTHNVNLKDYTYMRAMKIKGALDPIVKITLMKNNAYVFESFNKAGSFITFNEAFDNHKTECYSGDIVINGLWINSETKTFGLTIHLKKVVLLN